MKFILEIALPDGWDFTDIECALIGVKRDMAELAEIPCLPSPDNYEGEVLDDDDKRVGKWAVTK